MRGTLLYVATWSPGSNGSGANDHFIFISDQLLPSASTAAPWGKAGTIGIAGSKPFLAGESLNNYAGWTNAPNLSAVAKAATNSGQMEGVMDLVNAFDSMPPTIYIAAVAYGTSNGGAIAAQCPAGNGDGNLDPNEFLALPIAAILDQNVDGKYDRLDPAISFVVVQITRTNGTTTIRWNSVPGKTYQVEGCDHLGGTWTAITNQMTAGPGALTTSADDATALPSRFYRVRLTSP